jgi:hypothetical protein
MKYSNGEDYKEEADPSAVPKGTAAGADFTGRAPPTLTFGPSAQQMQSIASSTGGSPPEGGTFKVDMAQMLEKVLHMQTDLFAKALGRRDDRKGVIKIAPVIKWPILENDNIDVEEFYEEFESI